MRMRPRRAVGQRRTSMVLSPQTTSAAQGCLMERAYIPDGFAAIPPTPSDSVDLYRSYRRPIRLSNELVERLKFRHCLSLAFRGAGVSIARAGESLRAAKMTHFRNP